MIHLYLALKFDSFDCHCNCKFLFVLFSNLKMLRFADCETVSVDENMIGKEAAVIANYDAKYEIPTWKRCSAECLRKLLPNQGSSMFGRRASLSMLDCGVNGNDAYSPPPSDNGLRISAVGSSTTRLRYYLCNFCYS